MPIDNKYDKNDVLLLGQPTLSQNSQIRYLG